MDFALIGNCSYQALIDSRAKLVWLCWPRFDSSFVFGSLLDSEKGGSFQIEPAANGAEQIDDQGKTHFGAKSFTSTQRYLPNTNILETVFRSGDDAFSVVDFAPRFTQYDRFYKPNMLIRRIRKISGNPRARVLIDPVYQYGKENVRPTTASNHIKWSFGEGELRLTSNVPLNYIDSARPFIIEDDLYLCLTWGHPLEAPLEATCQQFYSETKRYWERWVKHTQLPGVMQQAVIRSALALKLHQYEDTGAITAAATTSLPEEDGAGRNWDYRYCWLRDSYFTLRAMRKLGHFEEMEGFVHFLKNIVQSAGDRLQPVFAIDGNEKLTEIELDHLRGYLDKNQPVRAGNDAYRQIQNDAYGEMVGAIAPLLLDIRFDNEHEQAVIIVAKLLEKIELTMEEPDAGLWEYRGMARVHTFTLLMHWAGARIAEKIAKLHNSATYSEKAAKIRDRAAELIESTYRPELGFYADAIGTDNPDAALFMMVNLGYLKAEDPKAEKHVRSLEAALGKNLPLMHRYKHQDDFGVSTSSFTVCGFWYAEALARLGHREEAMAALAKLQGYSNHVGLFSEDIDPDSGEQWGNFPQTYSHVGLINTAFAISPLPEELED